MLCRDGSHGPRGLGTPGQDFYSSGCPLCAAEMCCLPSGDSDSGSLQNLLCPHPGSPPPVQPSLLCHNQSQQLWSCSLLQAGSSAAGGAEEDGQEKGVSGAGWGGDRAGRESVLSRRRDGIQWIPQRAALPSSPGSALGPAEGSGEERGQEEALGQKSLNNEEEQLISVELMNWTGEILPSCVNKPSSQQGSCSWSSCAEAAGDGSIKM